MGPELLHGVHGFERMPASTRSVAVELHENAEAIEQWRSTLPQKQRRRLVHPLSNVRRWRASTSHGDGRCPADLKRDAVAAWRRFVSCVGALPPDQAIERQQRVSMLAAIRQMYAAPASQKETRPGGPDRVRRYLMRFDSARTRNGSQLYKAR
jgi:hypothetical protein